MAPDERRTPTTKEVHRDRSSESSDRPSEKSAASPAPERAPADTGRDPHARRGHPGRGRRHRGHSSGRYVPALRHLRLRGHTVRCGTQHHTGALRLLQRLPLPGQARFGRRDHQHRRPQRRRLRQRGRPGLLLLRHDLHHHQDLRPELAPQRPDHRGSRRQRRPGRRRDRRRPPGHGRRPRGVRRLRVRRRRLPRQQHHGHRHRQLRRGRVHGDQRPPREQPLLLRLRQRRDVWQRHR